MGGVLSLSVSLLPTWTMNLDKLPSIPLLLKGGSWSAALRYLGACWNAGFQFPPRPIDSVYILTKSPADLKVQLYFAFIIVELPFPESGITNFAFPGSPSTTGPWEAATLCRCGRPFLEKASAPNCTFSTMVSMKYVDLTVTKTWCKDSRAIITATMRPGEGGDKECLLQPTPL